MYNTPSGLADITGRVKIGNITDQYVKDFKSLYRVGALVTAKVIGYVIVIIMLLSL